MSTKVEHKRVEELENYDITKAAEDDVLLIVGTNDGNKSGKIPVSEFRDQMAKISVINLVVMVISFLESIMKGKNNETFHIATAFDVAAKYIKTNWFDFSTGTPKFTALQTLKTALASAIRQATDDAFVLIKTLWNFGGKNDPDRYYLGRTTKELYTYTAPEGYTQPNIIYVLHYEEGGKKYSKEYASQEAAMQTSSAQTPGATIEIADWAGGADKQPYVFDWTKQRVSDLISAMDMEEFISGFNPLSSLMNSLTKMGDGINQLSEAVQQMSPVVQGLASANLEARIAALEQALSQAQNSGSTGSPSNGGENQGDTEPDNGEDAALRSRAETLWAQFVGSDASNMTTEEMVAALENGANITPDPNATLAERIEALEALAAAQQ